jgi:hypothetical protein
MTNTNPDFPEFDTATLNTALHASIAQLILALNDDAARIAADNYSDDDTDYFPARAATYSNLIALLTTADSIDDLPDSLAFMIDHDEYFLRDLDTADITLPITTLLLPLLDRD